MAVGVGHTGTGCGVQEVLGVMKRFKLCQQLLILGTHPKPSTGHLERGLIKCINQS